MRLTRDVTKDECPWLHETLTKGTEVYHFRGHTYGCITNDGIACSSVENEYPFFELPRNAVGL